VADSSVIREFLASLGFRVDEAGLRKFTSTLVSLTTRAVGLGLAMEGMATDIGLAITRLADHFEQLFYLSQRVGSSVENITAFQYGLRQIGMSASDATQALTGMAMALRSNPGMEGLLRSLGVQTRNAQGGMRDTKDIMSSFVSRLAQMPFAIAARYAQIFGISMQALLQMEQNFAKERKAEQEWHEEVKRSGVDLDAAARASVEWMTSIRQIGAQLELLWDAVLIRLSGSTGLLPVLKQVHDFIDQHFDDIVRIGSDAAQFIIDDAKNLLALIPIIDDLVTKTMGWKRALDLLADVIVLRIFGPLGLTLKILSDVVADYKRFTGANPDKVPPAGAPKDWTPEERQKFDAQQKELFDTLKQKWQEFIEWMRGPIQNQSYNAPGSTPFAPGNTQPAAFHPGNTSAFRPGASGVAGPGNLFAGLERAYGLPAGLLDSVWAAESNRGRDMSTSSAGAKGHFQFLDSTARQYGVTNPYDLANSATGASKYFYNLLKHYAGDIRKAIAGYNWGEGNLDKDIARWGSAWDQHLPAETRNYLGKVLAGIQGAPGSAPLGATGGHTVTIYQNTNITVAGGADPTRTGTEVATRQRGVNADLVRSAGAVMA
jgi:transglycosylase-like protein with SLT domain